MNIILVAINAKYIHSSLAAYSLYTYLPWEAQQHVQIKEFTINQSEALITSELLRTEPDALAFSCYIWNIDLVMSIVETFKKVMPHIPIILGGPEVSYAFDTPLADLIVRGEGEEPFKNVVRHLIEGRPLSQFSLGVDSTTLSEPPLETIPFPYHGRFPDLVNRIIYYETSRGCVNRCGFCLSSATEGVRFLDWDRVQTDLDIFLKQHVKQVKFVDRTFNCSKHHAVKIWSYLIANDNGITNFHFEIAGEQLDEELLTLLSTARKGLFQFEIGVQSTNTTTLDCISRATNTAQLFDNVRRLMAFGNIHLHLDLIVGLPHEDFASFQNSFNDVFALRPHKLQIGFLKLLRGSRLRQEAEKYGIVYKKDAPYSVLQTDSISFEEINTIHKIEHMVETFYGGTGFEATIRFLLAQSPTPFHMFQALAACWERKDMHLASHKKAAMYTFLHTFAMEYLPQKLHHICELLKFDMLLQENIRTFPDWITDYYIPDNRLITRTTGVHTFAYDICTWLKEGGQRLLSPQDITVHYNYALGVDDGRISQPLAASSPGRG